MNTEAECWQQLQRWLQADPQRLEALQCAAELALPQWCLGAGFVRNLVWDRLHGDGMHTALNDIDLVYFDAGSATALHDQALEQQLAQRTALPFSVKNQARMHLHSGREPFSSCEDALRYWVEVETAVAVYLDTDGRLQCLAPFGLLPLFSLSVRHNPLHGDARVFQRRLSTKGWLHRWPRLRQL